MSPDSHVWPLAIIAASAFGIALIGAEWPRTVETNAADWLGFLGAIIGGAFTLCAAMIAFGLTRRQVDMQAEELGEIQREKDERAHMVRVMMSAVVARIKKEVDENIQKIEVYRTQHGVPPNYINEFSTVRNIVGYGEIWRINEDEARAIMLLDIDIDEFSAMANARKGRVGQYIQSAFVFRQMEGISRRAAEIAHSLDGERST